MLRRIIKELLASEPDIELVGELPPDAELVGAVRASQAHTLVLEAANGSVPAACRPLVDDQPTVRVVALTSDGRETFLYELHPRELSLGELSPERLLDAVRGRALGGDRPA